MSDIWVRPFQRADAAACAQVFYEAVHVGAADHYTVGQRLAWCPALPAADAFGDFLETQTCFVVKTAQVCGFMSLDNSLIDMAYVAPDQRGSGMADMLYAVTLNAAIVQGITHLTTHASHMARSFFLRQGWQVDASETVQRGDQSLQRYQMSFQIC